jgi:hypothetical protein
MSTTQLGHAKLACAHRRRVMRFKRGAVAAAAAAAVFAGAMLADAPAALAYGPSYCNASSCLTSTTSSTGGYFFDMPRGTAVSMVCWTDDQWWNGTNRWFKVHDIYGTGTNWMNANQVGHQTSVGHC